MPVMCPEANRDEPSSPRAWRVRGRHKNPLCVSRQAETNSLTHLEHGGYVHGREKYARAQHDTHSVSRSNHGQNSSLDRHEHGKDSQNCHEHLRQHTDTGHRNTEKPSSSSFSCASSSSSSSLEEKTMRREQVQD